MIVKLNSLSKASRFSPYVPKDNAKQTTIEFLITLDISLSLLL